MADNIAVTEGTGKSVRTDDVGGQQVQIIKVAIGGDGVAVDAIAGAGASGTGTLRVTAATDDVNLAAINTATAASKTDLDTLAGAVSSARVAVNVVSGQAGITAGAGAVAASTPRVTLASDDPAVASLSTLAGTVSSSRQAVNPIVGQSGVGAGAGAVGATVQRMTLASDDPAVAKLGTIDTNVATLAGTISSSRQAVNPIVGQSGVGAGAGAVGATVQRVTLASDDPAVTKLTAGAASMVKLEDVASADGDAGVPSMAIQKATPADTAGTDGDYAMLQMSAGRLWTSTVVPATAASIAKAEDVASADADVGVPAMAVRKATPANTSGTDGDYEMLQMSAGRLWASAVLEATEVVVGKTVGPFTTINTSVTRPADTTAYAVNDTWSDSTSAPTSGGFTFTSAARLSGGSGLITDAVITSSADPATTLQGEIWIFDQAGTNINDNAAFTMSDSDVLNLVGLIPFTLASTVAGSGTNSFAHVNGLNIGFTCVGTANLRFIVKVKNTYTPTSAEVLNVKLKIAQM